MTHRLEFTKAAIREWRKLDGSIREQFVKRLAERLENPHVPSAALRGDGLPLYKIKLRDAGYRLVYRVQDDIVVVTVLAVGRRDRVYESLRSRLSEE